ncbi:hypothetical protein Lal_00036074 [Lupinus albus]|nr:hypothetical protein Lal_00036074 [Lupinus albus]
MNTDFLIMYSISFHIADQSVVDRAINDICVLMQCSRHNLNVVSAGNGYNMRSHSILGHAPCLRLMGEICICYRLIMGWVRFFEGKRIFDCIGSPNTAHPVPVHVEEIKVFQRLANDQFCNANRCIIITGRGYPDIPTRRFLRLLVETLHLPVYCLVDCDPYGFDILTTYRFGSMQLAYDTKHLGVPEIQWLGAFPSDPERFFVPKQCLLPLTAADKKKIEAMLLRCYLQKEVPQWRLELKLMLKKGVKFEIEALSVHTLSFLTESYIPSKIHSKVII